MIFFISAVVVVAVLPDGAVVMDAVAVATAWVAVDAVVDTLVAMVDAVEALVVMVVAVAGKIILY